MKTLVKSQQHVRILKFKGLESKTHNELSARLLLIICDDQF